MESDLRQWMRLVESENSRRFYHGSRHNFPIGFVFELHEHHRPRNKLSRSNCFFMVDNPVNIEEAGGDNDFVYEVKPIGRVDRSDVNWYTTLTIYLDEDEDEETQAIIANGYWSGHPYPRREPVYEFRAMRAKIIMRIPPS